MTPYNMSTPSPYCKCQPLSECQVINGFTTFTAELIVLSILTSAQQTHIFVYYRNLPCWYPVMNFLLPLHSPFEKIQTLSLSSESLGIWGFSFALSYFWTFCIFFPSFRSQKGFCIFFFTSICYVLFLSLIITTLKL